MFAQAQEFSLFEGEKKSFFFFHERAFHVYSMCDENCYTLCVSSLSLSFSLSHTHSPTPLSLLKNFKTCDDDTLELNFHFFMYIFSTANLQFTEIQICFHFSSFSSSFLMMIAIFTAAYRKSTK